jgi:aryl-alcohol dehydrogenase-like predicted oxidoreductase
MQTRKIGNQGLVSSALGLGCMSMTHGYGVVGDEAESIATIHHAIDRGVTLFDTAEAYGPHTNEELLGKAVRGRRGKILIATKFGIVIASDPLKIDGSPANAKRAIEGSLRRLGTDFIDLYYLHRKDPEIPIEESVGAMKELVEAGKVRYLGLSEVGGETLRRAHKVHPISALQSEYSLWERGIEGSALPAMRELGIGLVPFSPLGRGYLTGAFQSSSFFSERDFRRNLPRFSDQNMAKNAQLVDIVKNIAKRHSATPAQIALAWILTIAPDAVPIPGTKRIRYLDDNLGALDVRLSGEEMAELDQLASMTAGDRYPPAMARVVER